MASTSGRLHCELLRLLFLQAHRETEEYCRLFGVPAQTNQDSFRYKRAAFYFGITVRNRRIETGISEASKRVSIFSFATQGGKQVSFYFRQGNWVQARDAQIRFPAG